MGGSDRNRYAYIFTIRVFVFEASANRTKSGKLNYKVQIPHALDMGDFTDKKGQRTAVYVRRVGCIDISVLPYR